MSTPDRYVKIGRASDRCTSHMHLARSGHECRSDGTPAQASREGPDDSARETATDQTLRSRALRKRYGWIAYFELAGRVADAGKTDDYEGGCLFCPQGCLVRS